jgi:hypothetical protein
MGRAQNSVSGENLSSSGLGTWLRQLNLTIAKSAAERARRLRCEVDAVRRVRGRDAGHFATLIGGIGKIRPSLSIRRSLPLPQS